MNEVSAARRGACGGVQIEYSMLKTHLSLVVVAAPALLANGFRVRARVRPSDVQGRTKPWVIGSVAPFFKVPLVR